MSVAARGGPSPTDVNARSARAAALAAATLGLAVGFVGLYFGTLSIFLKPLASSFGWSRAETALLTSTAMIGFAVGSPLLGTLIDRWGARRLIGASVLLLSAMILIQSFLPANYALFLAVSFAIGLLGVGTGPAGYLSLLPRVFDRRLGLALSIAMAGSGLGASLLPIVAHAVLAGGGWREAYRTLALIALVVGSIAWWLVGRTGTPQRMRNDPVAPIQGVSLRKALGDRRFWTLAITIFVATAGGLGATLHVAALLSDRGMSARDAATIAAFSGLGLLTGRFLGGMIMDLVFAPAVAAAGFLLGAAGLIGIAITPASSFPLLAGCSLLFGFALGAEGDFAAFAVRRYFGTVAFGAIYGCIMASYALGGIAGPILFGIGFDRMGSYTAVLTTAAIGYAAAAGAVLTLGTYRWTRS